MDDGNCVFTCERPHDQIEFRYLESIGAAPSTLGLKLNGARVRKRAPPDR